VPMMSSGLSKKRQGFEAMNGGETDEVSLSKEACGSAHTGAHNPVIAGRAKAESKAREKTSTSGWQDDAEVSVEGRGQRFERETVITFNEAEPSASVWTASETVYRRLKNLGYVPTQDNERSAVFEVPKGLVKILRRRPKRELTEKQRENIQKAISARRTKQSSNANEHENADG
jgi:hypothetical protein